MKKKHFFISYLLLLIVGVLFVSCSGNDPKEPKELVITAETDTTLQNITSWDTIRCPYLKISSQRWQTTSDGLDTFYNYLFCISTPGNYEIPTPVEIEGNSMMAYAPFMHYELFISPKYDESGQMIPYYYFTSTKAGTEVGKICVKVGNQCSISDSYAGDIDSHIHNIRQCTVRITPSENGQDLFECRMSVVGWDNKLMYHYIVGPIDYNPLWER